MTNLLLRDLAEATGIVGMGWMEGTGGWGGWGFHIICYRGMSLLKVMYYYSLAAMYGRT